MNGSRKKGLFITADIVAALIFILLDQFTKHLAVIHLKDRPSLILWPKVFELRYLENRGAAFGMLQGQKLFFLTITCIVVIGIIYILCKIPENKKYNILHILLVLVFSGAIGNMIDRIRLSYVVDFFYFVLIDFPIFNMADIYVSVACVLLAILMIFVYKDEDLEFISMKSLKGSK
ncbi:MAG: signal peptidase II [Lachnospiraceae bacterium]|nr:signal peptidase II [Lachnospiraceae bacterium]